MKKRPIHFLSYLNRSGSTLLAKKLNELKDISVGIEMKMSNYIQKSFYATKEEELDDWLNITYNDIKFKSWNIDKKLLKNNLLSLLKPVLFDDFLKESLYLYFKNDDAKILLYKGRTHFLNFEKSEKKYPGSCHIFIDRDPRAIFNSQKKSIDSTTKQIMQNDIVNFAVSYKNNQKKIEYYLQSPRYNKKLLMIKYENLLLNESEELQKVTDFFKVSESKAKSKNYYSKIPEEQKHLHENLIEKNKLDRIDAWKNELDRKEINFLNLVLNSEIKKNKYKIDGNSSLKILNDSLILIWLIKFYIKFLPKHLIRVLLIFLKIRNIY